MSIIENELASLYPPDPPDSRVLARRDGPEPAAGEAADTTMTVNTRAVRAAVARQQAERHAQLRQRPDYIDWRPRNPNQVDECLPFAPCQWRDGDRIVAELEYYGTRYYVRLEHGLTGRGNSARDAYRAAYREERLEARPDKAVLLAQRDQAERKLTRLEHALRDSNRRSARFARTINQLRVDYADLRERNARLSKLLDAVNTILQLAQSGAVNPFELS